MREDRNRRSQVSGARSRESGVRPPATGSRLPAPRRSFRTRGLGRLLVALLLGILPAGLRAQEVAPAAEPAQPPAPARVAVVTEAGTPMVALELLLAVGPLDEEPAHAGITYLAARAVVEPIRPRLEEMGASLAVHSYKDAIGYSLLAAPDAWEAASQLLLVALFRDPVDSLAVERERRAIRAELESRQSNPADALATEVDRAFWGTDHPWGRPAVGTLESVQRIRLADVDAFLRDHFLPNRTFAAVAGPVAHESAAPHLTQFLGTERPARPRSQAGMPDDVFLRQDYNSITTWISASYRFGEGADLEALRLLAHLATQAISFGPRRPSIYNAWSEVYARPGEGEIRFQIVVPPGQAEEWAERMQEAVAQFAARPLTPEAFEQTTRSYRGSRLLALNSPDDRARELARRLFLTGGVGPLIEFETLSPERLHAAARSLESPIVLLLGPTPRTE